MDAAFMIDWHDWRGEFRKGPVHLWERRVGVLITKW